MDSITHVLSAALWTEPVGPPLVAEGGVYARWRERAAVVVAALAPDIDGLLGLPDALGLTSAGLYARWHRVATHSVVGLAVIVLASAALARAWPERWLLPSMRTRARGRSIVKPSWRRLFAFSGIAVGWHVAGDAITNWGTLTVLWPFSDASVQLGRVNSLDASLLALTVGAWAVQHVCLNRGWRRAAWGVAGLWLGLAALYVWLRPLYGAPAYV